MQHCQHGKKLAATTSVLIPGCLWSWHRPVLAQNPSYLRCPTHAALPPVTSQRKMRCYSSLDTTTPAEASMPAEHASQLQLSGSETPSELLQLLQQGSLQGLVSPEMVAVLEQAASVDAASALSHTQLAQLLQGMAAAVDSPSPTWTHSMLSVVQTRIQNGLSEDDMPQLAALLWGVSELGCSPPQAWLDVAAQRLLSGIDAGSFFASDLCTCICALGSLGYKPNSQVASQLAKEIQLQLKEFLKDFTPQDVARLASGVADLNCRSSFSPDFSEQLMKAVYSKVWKIQDKAAVDFALAKLDNKDKSMHYDARWTHEELNWLPRSERDKRRIIKENWVRTQWGGWS